MEQEIVSTRLPDALSAADDLCRQLKNPLTSYNAVIFMAAITYDFEKLSAVLKEKFPNSEVIGTTTAGEIDAHGFKTGSIILTTMRDPATKVSSVLIEEGSKYPIAYKEDIEQALRDCRINVNDPNSHQHAFALTFINAIYNTEETILSNFYSIIKNDRFMLAGGTAGYTGNEPKSFISCKRKSYDRRSCNALCKHSVQIRHQTGRYVRPDRKSCLRYRIRHGKKDNLQTQRKTCSPGLRRRAWSKRIQGSELAIENAFGRYINGAIHIAAIAGFGKDRSVSTYARIVPNSTLEVMHIGDIEKKCDETCQAIVESVKRPKFVLMMNCILRTIYFEQHGYSSKVISKYRNAFPTFCGFSCYGEQLGKGHCSETLVVLAIGD